MNITLSQLNRLTLNLFPNDRITLVRILVAWAQIDPDGELSTNLKGAGLTCRQMAAVLGPLSAEPSKEDLDLLNRIIMTDTSGPVTGWHLLKALCDHPGHRVTRTLSAAGLKLAALRTNLHQAPAQMPGILAGIRMADPQADLLERYGRNLTALAREGIFDDLCHREADLNRIMAVLQKKNKGNSVLTGPAGVGKTALVELFAKRIVDGTAPDFFVDYQIFEISMGKLLAGTIYRGQFEERLQGVLNALNACRPAILFIDEMHLIWGAGRASGAPMDAANMLKPVLARGEVKLIGATTIEEYHQYIRKDAALERRFEEIRLQEPDGELLRCMIHTQAEGLVRHHGIAIPAAVQQKAVELTNRYLPNRFQPDKSIDLMDTGSVLVAGAGRQTLTENDLVETLARMTGRPIGMPAGKEADALKTMAQQLKAQIVGQDEAMDKIAATLIYRRQMFNADERNLGTFLFSGDTGVGKTETAKVLATIFCGDKKKLLHLDMAEYSLPDGVHKLIGAPHGLVGSEKEGVLTQFLHAHGTGVILFDEIEKAHPEIHRLLLGLLDNGRIRSACGEALDTRQFVVILTTNAIRPDALSKKSLGFAATKSDPDLMEMLSDHFPREFLGRLDEIILFNPLSPQTLRTILGLRLKEMLARLKKKRIHVVYDQQRLLDYLLRIQPPNTGARGIARLLEKKLLQPIALQSLLTDADEEVVTIVLDDAYYREGKITVAFPPNERLSSPNRPRSFPIEKNGRPQ